jgi:hypothetical protein
MTGEVVGGAEPPRAVIVGAILAVALFLFPGVPPYVTIAEYSVGDER